MARVVEIVTVILAGEAVAARAVAGAVIVALLVLALS